MKRAVMLYGRRIHRGLLWVAMVALLAFVLSAFTHPLMVWTGPQPKAFMPPSLSLNGNEVQGIPRLLGRHEVAEANIVKVVASAQGNLLQVTHSAEQPRAYYNLVSGEELAGYDTEQAVWLARYYSGETGKVLSVDFITAFSDEYPEVNRLLSVYKVNFTTPDQLSVFVYTETNALAGITNNWKRVLREIFQLFHTWSWLDDAPMLRVLLVFVLLLSVLGSAVSGLAMLVLIKRKRQRSRRHGGHRVLAYVVIVPVLGFTVSGMYHLFQAQYGSLSQGVRLTAPVSTQEAAQAMRLSADWVDLSSLQGQALSGFSVVEYAGRYYYRAGFAAQRQSQGGAHAHHHAAEQEQRFAGRAAERQASYIAMQAPAEQAVESAERIALNDATYSRYLADKAAAAMGLPSSTQEIRKITRFSGEYDFRNKRLPVWKVTLDGEQPHWLFVDPASGVLADQVANPQRYERAVFSFLHKWNFTLAMLDRQSRDVLISVFLLLIMMLALLGVSLRKR